MSRGLWIVDLTADAAQDIENIVEWSAHKFGSLQAVRYSSIIASAVLSLSAGPLALGSLPGPVRRRKKYRKIHLTLNRSGASHLLFYLQTGERRITIVRVLHESMDHGRHLA